MSRKDACDESAQGHLITSTHACRVIGRAFEHDAGPAYSQGWYGYLATTIDNGVLPGRPRPGRALFQGLLEHLRAPTPPSGMCHHHSPAIPTSTKHIAAGCLRAGARTLNSAWDTGTAPGMMCFSGALACGLAALAWCLAASASKTCSPRSPSAAISLHRGQGETLHRGDPARHLAHLQRRAHHFYFRVWLPRNYSRLVFPLSPRSPPCKKSRELAKPLNARGLGKRKMCGPGRSS